MLDSPQQFFLERFGLTDRNLDRVLGTALEQRADWADCYFEYRVVQTASLEEGVVRKATRNVRQGVGVRVLAGTRTGYAYSDEVSLDRLELAARTARCIADESGGTTSLASTMPARGPHDLYAVTPAPIETPLEEQVALLHRLDAVARAADPAITNVLAGIGIEHRVILVATPSGFVVGDVRPLVHLSVTCIAERDGQRRQGSHGGGGRFAFGELVAGRGEHFAREAARQALVNLEATPAPAGTMNVVLGPGWPGILLHEAVGHGLEGDFNRKGTSAFSNRLNTRVASELCTVVDDGTIASRRGSLNVDDEGTPTGRTVLIEKGILRGYLQDRLNASLMKMPLTGNGRRESFAHMPMPRMTNTFMLAGDDDPEDIIRSVDHGLYAVAFGGGSVDITSGKFVFSASEAYMIEGGKIGRPVRDATLVGNGPDVMTRITRVGADLALDDGVGTCGKDGQSVPVGVGLPTIRIDGLTVGGTQA
ncbi:MAG TPA: metalloprotease TldD [Candidatus Binatia bacterium]|jgi:TldD protein|nr:metalloprotease TldD [Candidatus Binatia bacterium]